MACGNECQLPNYLLFKTLFTNILTLKKIFEANCNRKVLKRLKQSRHKKKKQAGTQNHLVRLRDRPRKTNSKFKMIH